MGIAAVTTALKAYLGAGFSAAPVAWPNDAFEPPLAGDGAPLPWIAAEVQSRTFAQQSIGAYPAADNRWDEEGFLSLYVMVPAGTGSATLDGLTDSLRELFRGTTLLGGNLDFPGRIDSDSGGPAQHDGAYFQRTITVPWRLMEA